MAENKAGENGVTSLSLEELSKQARASLEKKTAKVVTRAKIGQMFIRVVNSRGKTYRQVCRHYRDQDGKRRLEIARITWPNK